MIISTQFKQKEQGSQIHWTIIVFIFVRHMVRPSDLQWYSGQSDMDSYDKGLIGYEFQYNNKFLVAVGIDIRPDLVSVTTTSSNYEVLTFSYSLHIISVFTVYASYNVPATLKALRRDQ